MLHALTSVGDVRFKAHGEKLVSFGFVVLARIDFGSKEIEGSE